MSYKINSFTVIDTAEGKRISYTYMELDADGNILKNNLRKSTQFK